MLMARKLVVFLLSLVLLVSLLGVAFSTGSNMALSHPDKLENWLNQSKLYDHFVATVANEIQKSASGNRQTTTAPPVNTTLEQAVRVAFTPQMVQQNVNTFLNSNYGWLEGKTSSPGFVIDLTAAKQNLAEQIGQYVETRFAGLPVCTDAQLAQAPAGQSIDYLATPCRPVTLTPQVAAAQVTQQLNAGGGLLGNSVVTASSISPKGNDNTSQPYYQKFSAAPKLYRLGLKLPWIFGGLALLSTLGIVFIASRKRKGVRRLGAVLLVAGVILVAVKFVSDTAFSQLEKQFFNNSSVGQLQQSLTDFLHRIEAQLVKVDFWFGLAFLVLALVLIGTLWFTRQKAGDAAKPGDADETGMPQTGDKQPFPELKQPPRPKRPRLIQ
jgi:hypothetical protein